MKKRVVRAAGLLTASSAFLAGCGLIGELDYTVTPDPMEMHGDSIEVTVEVNVPEKGLNKKAEAIIVPKVADQELKPIMLQGEKVTTGNGKTIAFKEGGKYSYTDKIAYTDAMENTKMTAHVKAFKTGKESKATEFDVDSIAVGTKITPRLVKGDDKVILGKDNFVRVTQHETGAVLHYQKMKHNVQSSELKDSDMVALKDFMVGADTNDRIEVKSIGVTSYASPEGEVAKNDNLASDRAKSAKNAIMDLAKKNKLKTGSDEASIVESPQGEDWDGAKSYLAESSLSDDDKQKVESVLSMYSNPADRQRQINAMSKINKTLEKEVLSPLRRSQIMVKYDKTGYTDEELKELVMNNPDTLTVEEILFAATLFESEDDQLRIYKEAQRIYADDWRGFNNAGFILYAKDDLAGAKGEFEKAMQIEETAIVMNNLGAIARREGDIEKAKELYAEASSAGPEVKYNMGIIHIIEGDYPKAVANLGDEKTFNKGLAMYLNGDADGAVATLNDSEDNESAMGYYLKAIVGASKDNFEMVKNNLKSAFGLDSSLKAKAAKDMNFFAYFNNSEFASMVK